MYAAIRQYEMGAGSVADFMRAVDEGFADALSQQPGFRAYHVIASGSDEIVAVTLFEDQGSAAWSDEVAAEFVRERLQQFQLNLTSSMSGEVGVSRVTSEAPQAPQG
jgi:Antibiotic biosynthesis monooxygenase